MNPALLEVSGLIRIPIVMDDKSSGVPAVSIDYFPLNSAVSSDDDFPQCPGLADFCHKAGCSGREDDGTVAGAHDNGSLTIRFDIFNVLDVHINEASSDWRLGRQQADGVVWIDNERAHFKFAKDGPGRFNSSGPIKSKVIQGFLNKNLRMAFNNQIPLFFDNPCHIISICLAKANHKMHLVPDNITLIYVHSTPLIPDRKCPHRLNRLLHSNTITFFRHH